MKTPNGIEQIEAEDNAAAKREYEIAQETRPLTLEEVQRIAIRQTVNSLSIDNRMAGRMIGYFPTRAEYCAEGELIPAKTRVRDDSDASIIWRSNVDLWNTPQNSPQNAPALWERVAYRNGIRIAPETFTAENAAQMGEYMWFGEELWQSCMAGNAYTPAQSPQTWTKIER